MKAFFSGSGSTSVAVSVSVSVQFQPQYSICFSLHKISRKLILDRFSVHRIDWLDANQISFNRPTDHGAETETATATGVFPPLKIPYTQFQLQFPFQYSLRSIPDT